MLDLATTAVPGTPQGGEGFRAVSPVALEDGQTSGDTRSGTAMHRAAVHRAAVQEAGTGHCSGWGATVFLGVPEPPSREGRNQNTIGRSMCHIFVFLTSVR